MSDLTAGVVLCLIGGIVNGSFASPTKFVKHWKWENIWAVWAVVGMVLFPWFLVFVTVPDVVEFYRGTELRYLLRLVAFGTGFGLAQIFFGLGVAAVGIALNFAIAIGLSTAGGSLIPLVFLQRHMIFTYKGGMILLGVFVTLIGILACAIAGRMKEKQTQGENSSQPEGLIEKRSFMTGLLFSILAGVGSPLINFGLAFGAPLLARAAQMGVSPASQTNVIWAPLVSASLVPYLAYCIYLWRKNRTWGLYAQPGTGVNWLLGATMGVLWMGSTAIYGAATARMAGMGPILGWPLFMSVIIITSNVWGFMTGEWKGAGGRALAFMLGGIVFLILGFCTLAYASKLS